MAATGTLAPSQVAVVPGPARVGAVIASVGDPSSSPVLSLTRTAKLITFTAKGDLRTGESLTVTTASHPGALAVPVETLVALADGGFALQTPGGLLLPVRIGPIVNDQVEVSGPGIRAGRHVVTAA